MSSKIATTKHPLLPVISNRWSARSFSEKPISEDTILQLFEAASWAPSSMNEQPWRYKYAHHDQKKSFALFHDCLMGGNQPWCKNAAVLIMSLAKKNFTSNGQANRHHLYDVGAANLQLLLQAQELSIYGHILGGFHMDKAREVFEVPDDMEIACFMALGYLDVADKLEEPFKTRELAPRSRKPLQEIIERV